MKKQGEKSEVWVKSFQVTSETVLEIISLDHSTLGQNRKLPIGAW